MSPAPHTGLLRLALCALSCVCLGLALAQAALPALPRELLRPTPRAADFLVREWHGEDGLPGEDVMQLLQDHEGYLLVACRNALVRFDGASFFPDAAAESRNTFYTIAEAADGGLLLGPREGPLLRRRRADTYVRETLPEGYSDRAVGAIMTAPDGSRWYSLRGALLRLKDGAWQTFGAEAGVSAAGWTRLAADTAGRLWVAGNSLLARQEGDRLVPLPLEGPLNELRIVPSRQGGP